MKFVAQYIERAVDFERLASDTDDDALKGQLLKQAADCRRLAERRAIALEKPLRPQHK